MDQLIGPKGIQRNFWKVIFQLIKVIDGWGFSCKIVLKWMPMDITDNKSTLFSFNPNVGPDIYVYVAIWRH